MHSIIGELKNQLIVSCQAFPGEPMYGADVMAKMAVAGVKGGGKGIRACWPETIREVKKVVSVPVVGINKIAPEQYDVRDDIIITPTLESALAISEAGADIIAIDGTLRNRSLEAYVKLVKEIQSLTRKPMMADLSTFEEAQLAVDLGIDIVGTTLSGYTRYSRQNVGPDLDLIAEINQKLDVPINAEGRFFETADVRRAFEIGAWCMTIGSAITRPEWITHQYVDAIQKETDSES